MVVTANCLRSMFGISGRGSPAVNALLNVPVLTQLVVEPHWLLAVDPRHSQISNDLSAVKRFCPELSYSAVSTAEWSIALTWTVLIDLAAASVTVTSLPTTESEPRYAQSVASVSSIRSAKLPPSPLAVAPCPDDAQFEEKCRVMVLDL